MNSNQRGVGALEMVLLLVLVGLIGVVGWFVYKANNDNLGGGDYSDTSARQSDIPAVNSASDLKATEQYLNSQDLDKELNTSEIDAALE